MEKIAIQAGMVIETIPTQSLFVVVGVKNETDSITLELLPFPHGHKSFKSLITDLDNILSESYQIDEFTEILHKNIATIKTEIQYNISIDNHRVSINKIS